MFFHFNKKIVSMQYCFSDIDDCAESPCLNEGECVDEVTSYQCECKPGFEGKNCEEFKGIIL